MKLAVSAIAWHESEDKEAFSLLASKGVQYLEYVPVRIKKGLIPCEPIEQMRKLGIKPVAFQALLFGTEGLHLFQDESARKALASHLQDVIEKAAEQGVEAIVFGSPKNRSFDPVMWTREKALQEARNFFGDLGQIAHRFGVKVCMETNPEFYQCNFLTTTIEAAEFVRSVGSPGIALNLDLGAMLLNDEDPSEIWMQVRDVVAHVHISEPNLIPVGSQNATHSRHRALARALKTSAYAGTLSIEMARAKDDWAMQLNSAIEFVRTTYAHA